MSSYRRLGPVLTGIDIEVHDAMAWGNPADNVIVIDVGAIERMQTEITGQGTLIWLRHRPWQSQEVAHATESVQQIRAQMGRGVAL